MRVLVVEDEPKMARLLSRGLTEEGYGVDVAADSHGGFTAAQSADYDALVLDVMLPAYPGFELCRRLRERGVLTPVLMLTARDGVGDRVKGLDSGADDYLAKPFHFEELLARLRALARRGPLVAPTVLAAGDLRLDPEARRCWRGNDEIALTAKEYALLEFFLERPGRVLTRQMLVENCWDVAFEANSNVVDVHVRALRGKIDRRFGVFSLETVRGAGYRLRADGGRAEAQR
ncbi:response regulator transcription factor [Sinomonas sp. G460-2]|uniref:response regulator transcription factor n=1 Tax=Sinomonas sp. G460-2 TaxID=3393464 RepID=UPI0039EFFDFD